MTISQQLVHPFKFTTFQLSGYGNDIAVSLHANLTVFTKEDCDEVEEAVTNKVVDLFKSVPIVKKIIEESEHEISRLKAENEQLLIIQKSLLDRITK